MSGMNSSNISVGDLPSRRVRTSKPAIVRDDDSSSAKSRSSSQMNTRDAVRGVRSGRCRGTAVRREGSGGAGMASPYFLMNQGRHAATDAAGHHVYFAKPEAE